MSGDKNAPAAPAATEPQAPPRLRRVLGLWDLVFYGIVLIQPVGAVGPFGLANKMSLGHVTATILIARPTVAAPSGPWQKVLRRPVSVADVVAAAETLLPMPSKDRHPLD